MSGPARFQILNHEGKVQEPEDWNASDRPKLWRYHLHYFHDLNARDADDRRGWHRDLICRWIRENPPAEGIGWDPYPTSLRIVNWIKWSLLDEDHALPEPAVHSLAIQSRWLESRLEHHLQGNHLLANAKALIFAGSFFEGEEGRRWERKGREVLEREIHEQILPDGGHFERSPMYHSLVLEDLLDLINVCRSCGRDVPDGWTRAVRAMKNWLAVMRHPDGEIPFFNDAAFGMAPTPRQVDDYARRLDVPQGDSSSEIGPIQDLPDSGYMRVEAGPAVALLDLAPVGPDHLPAHAHADTLSFELSLERKRLFVNAGTSTYEPGERRQCERGTSAHNTVAVNDEHSSEVWASFRVARRARIEEREYRHSGDQIRVTGSHDGYRRLDGGPLHRRTWSFDQTSMTVVDRVEGDGECRLDLYLHVHPEWKTVRTGEDAVAITRPDASIVSSVQFEGGDHLTVESGRYAPEFGRVEPATTLRYRTDARELPVELSTVVSWGPANREAGA